jgi:hypothetical protein
MDRNESNRTRRGPCTHFVLAHGAVVQVEYCVACAIFHLNLDTVSLRFRASALRDLRDTLSSALAAYERAVAHAEERARQEPPEGLH